MHEDKEVPKAQKKNILRLAMYINDVCYNLTTVVAPVTNITTS